MSRRLLACLSLSLVAAALSWVVYIDQEKEPLAQDDLLGRTPTFTPTPSKKAPVVVPDAPETNESEDATTMIVLYGEDGQLLGEGASIRLSAAGLYPPLVLEADGDGRALATLPPNPMLNAQEDGFIEVMVRTVEGGRGFWGVVEPSERGQDDELGLYEVQVKPASTLSVRVLDPSSEPIAMAKVRLALSDVHLLHRSLRTTESGRAAFEQLPQGSYVLEVDAPGFTSRRVEVFEHDGSKEGGLTVTMSPTREVYGCLVDEQGAGVADATILGHVARKGTTWFGRPLEATEVVRVDGPPVASLTQTDFDGCFSLTDLPAGQVYVHAQVAWAPLSVSGPFDVTQALELGPVELTLDEGSVVRVQVIGEDEQPVQGATVRWADVVTGRTGIGVSDVQGKIAFAGLSSRVVIESSLGTWRSASIKLGEPDLEGGFDVTTQLKRASSLSAWTLRLNAPTGVDPVSAKVSIASASGEVVCESKSINERDWSFEACPRGLGTLHVETSAHGVWSTQRRVGDDSEVSLPAPATTRVRIDGVAPPNIPVTTLYWSAEAQLNQKHQATLTALNASTLQWQSALYPGTYALEMRVGSESFARTLTVVEDPSDPMIWTISMPKRIEVRVLDARGAPVEGAVLRVLADGVVSDVIRTVPAGGMKLRTQAVKTLKVWAASGRHGEGVVELSVEDLPEVVTLRLEESLFFAFYPGRIQPVDAIEAALGEPLVEDDDALLMDITRRDSPAYKAGIPRGARLLDMRRSSKGTEVTFEYESKVRQAYLPAAP